MSSRLTAVFALFLIAFALFAVYFRAEVALFAWERYKVFPDAAIFFNKDARLARSAGDYFFRWYGRGEYDLEKAKKYYRQALALDPQTEGAWYQLGRIEFLHGHLNNAVNILNKELELHGELDGAFFMRTHYMKGLTYAYMNLYENAEREFLDLLEWNGAKTDWAVYADLSWTYFLWGKYEEAASAAEAGLKYHPDNPWILNMSGVALLNLGRHEEAAEVLASALEEVHALTEGDWMVAYPGNDPRVAPYGLSEFRRAVDKNLSLAREGIET